MKQNNQSVMWACPTCIVPMEYVTSFVNNSVHRYKCKCCEKKYDVRQVTERRKC